MHEAASRREHSGCGRPSIQFMNTTHKHNPRQERRDRQDDPSVADASGAASCSDAGNDELEHFQATYRDAAYYSTGRDWSDYAPAYRYGREAFEQHRDTRFEQIEDMLARDWEQAKASSRLAWVEARGAVLDAWQRAESREPHGRHDPRAALSKH
jgi:hypothetical protein